MSVTILLRKDLDDYTFEVELDGRTYGLRFRINLRDNFWYVDLTDANGDMIVAGTAFVLGVPLFGRCVDPRKPPGQMFAVSATLDDSDPRVGDLGERVQLIYFSSAELEE